MLDKKQIMDIIPHRDPFLLIDEVHELEPGVKISAVKYVREDEYYFKGHFPSNPVMPGVLVVEAMAQAGAVCALSIEKFKGKTAYFAGINNVKFKRKVVPGDTVIFEVELVKIIKNIGIGKGCAYVEGELAACAELTFAVT